jgi:ribose transport system ATP-binding protein
MASLETTITKLSGGNQQKAIVGRGLELGAGIYLLSEPTRGVDVGARADIYRILADRCASGAGVLLASSDLDEVVGLADRVYVMSRRRVVANVAGSEITSERLLAEATR